MWLNFCELCASNESPSPKFQKSFPEDSGSPESPVACASNSMGMPASPDFFPEIFTCIFSSSFFFVSAFASGTAAAEELSSEDVLPIFVFSVLFSLPAALVACGVGTPATHASAIFAMLSPSPGFPAHVPPQSFASPQPILFTTSPEAFFNCMEFDSVRVSEENTISAPIISLREIKKYPWPSIFLPSKFGFETSEPQLAPVAVFLCIYQPVRSISASSVLYSSINRSAVGLNFISLIMTAAKEIRALHKQNNIKIHTYKYR